MNETNSTTNPPLSATTPVATPSSVACPITDPATAFAALGNPWRWKIMLLLADGKMMSTSEIVSALGREFNGVSKHLRLLRAAGWVACKAGADRRCSMHHIPPAFRPEPGVLDYGLYRLRVPVNPPATPG